MEIGPPPLFGLESDYQGSVEAGIEEVEGGMSDAFTACNKDSFLLASILYSRHGFGKYLQSVFCREHVETHTGMGTHIDYRVPDWSVLEVSCFACSVDRANRNMMSFKKIAKVLGMRTSYFG